MTAFTYEGRPVPPDLREALLGDAPTRAWIVRAAVAHPGLADALLAEAAALVAEPEPLARAVGVQVLRALAARPRVGAVCDAFAAAPERFVGVPDPLFPERTLAQSALAFVTEAAPRTHAGARALLRRGLGVPELRVEAWRALAADDGESPLPHLADLIRQHPQLAGPVATQYALVHTALCERAAHAVADLPDEPKRAFAAALQKHLLRIHAVKRWVACRRVLFGK
jgi:hypothetical protein